MATREQDQEPLVNFFELSGPKPWSPSCWGVRFTLNYKGIPYNTIKVGFPQIQATCEGLFPSMEGVEATVPIIEILPRGSRDHEVLNDSIPIAELLNQRFSSRDGFRHVEGLAEIRAYEEKTGLIMRGVVRWIMDDIYRNAVQPDDGSKEFFKRTREEFTGCDLEHVTQIRGGGEEACLREIKNAWRLLQERMKDRDANGVVKWVEAASKEKHAKLMDLYCDDTFLKLMKKVEPYSW